jgi:hypothetical protein
MVTNSSGNKNFMQPIGRLSMHSKCLDFWVWGGRTFFISPLFPTCSLQVPNKFTRFSTCSPRVFPITPRINPICFAQSPPLLTYIAWPKEKSLHLSIESSILRSFRSVNFFLQWANQISSLLKNKIGLVKHPQHILKQITCLFPHILFSCRVSWCML